MSNRDIPPRKEWGAVRLLTIETRSKDRLGPVPLTLVSSLIHVDLSAEGPPVDTAGSKVKVKTEAYQEVLEDATPSEQAVRLSVNVLASKNNDTPLCRLNRIEAKFSPQKCRNYIRNLYPYPGCIL